MAISNPSLAQIKQALTEMLPKLKPLSVPTGMISAFHTVPDGWLQCNGAAVSRTTYAALFAVIGTKYGSGDGSTTFNLPNLHHKFIEGTTTSSEVGRSVSAGLPNITGKHANPNFQIFDAQYFGKGLSGAFTLETTSNRRGIRNSDGAYSGANFLFDASRSNSTYGSSSMVQPASTRLLACIKI